MIAPEKVHYVSFEENGHSMGFRFQVTDTERGGLGSGVPEFDELLHLHDGFIIRKSDLLEKYIFLASENMKHAGDPFITSSLLLLSIYDLAGGVPGNGGAGEGEDSHLSDIALTESIEQYLNESYHKKITLSDLARHVSLSNRQTERILARYFGMTYGELLCQKRLAAASLLLRTGEQTLEQIASACGFEDKAYFCRRFKERYGISPMQFRRAEGSVTT